jgi:hypothetical protein
MLRGEILADLRAGARGRAPGGAARGALHRRCLPGKHQQILNEIGLQRLKYMRGKLLFL